MYIHWFVQVLSFFFTMLLTVRRHELYMPRNMHLQDNLFYFFSFSGVTIVLKYMPRNAHLQDNLPLFFPLVKSQLLSPLKLARGSRSNNGHDRVQFCRGMQSDLHTLGRRQNPAGALS